MEGLYMNVRNDSRTRKDTWIWTIMVTVVCVFVIMGVVVIWFLGYHGRFSKFVSKLSDSTTYAYNNDGLTAEMDGEVFKVSDENMYGIFGYLSLSKSGRESRKVPEGEPVTLDYGNGSILKLWDMSADGRHHNLFVQYTDPAGDVYSYISYKATLDTVAVRYLTREGDGTDH